MDREIKCWTCGRTDFESWGDLAKHKLEMKDKAHRKDKAGRTWAANYKYKNVLMKQQDRASTPLTDEQREAKVNTKRELSGEKRIVPVKCPRCNTGRRDFIEVEHVENPQALRVDNCFVKLCEGCR